MLNLVFLENKFSSLPVFRGYLKKFILLLKQGGFLFVSCKPGVFGIINNTRGISVICGCTRYLHHGDWGSWAIETHTLLRNTIGLE